MTSVFCTLYYTVQYHLVTPAHYMHTLYFVLRVLNLLRGLYRCHPDIQISSARMRTQYGIYMTHDLTYLVLYSEYMKMEDGTVRTANTLGGIACYQRYCPS